MNKEIERSGLLYELIILYNIGIGTCTFRAVGYLAKLLCLPFREMWFTHANVHKTDKQTFPAETRCSKACRDSWIKHFTEGAVYCTCRQERIRMGS